MRTSTGPALRGTAEDRVARLSAVSLRRVIEPEIDLPGSVGPGRVLPDELLSTAGTAIALSEHQRIKLSREETAALTASGVALEGMLVAALGMYVAEAAPTDVRVTYALHELGEETRHSRLFARLIGQLQPEARNPFANSVGTFVQRRVMSLMIRDRVLMCVLILAGEEIPDLIQKRSASHPDTDEFLRRVNQYHRQEEARHIAFARTVLPEEWARASVWQRLRARRLAPFLVRQLFQMVIHPGVYEAVGLPGWGTWRAVNRSDARVALRQDATRPILEALIDAGAISPGRVPRGWRRLTGWVG